MGIAVSDRFELIFDTIAITRKARNLARNPHIAFVIGGSADGEEESVQYEGIADSLLPELDQEMAVTRRLLEGFRDHTPDRRQQGLRRLAFAVGL